MTAKNHIPDEYLGREQAFIKHYVLEKYLEKLTAILAVSRPNFEFAYVDCFAGPWQVEPSQMHTTSIAISLKVLEKCKSAVEARGGRATIRALFVEQSNEAYPQLEKYLTENTPSGITAHSIHGEFVASRHEILSWVGSQGYAFFFIDPKGWTEVKVETLKPLLGRSRSDFVINFMYDFINRTVSMARFAEEMKELLGEPVPTEMLDGRELAILNTYRRNLKEQVPKTRPSNPIRSAYVRILDPRADRTKYHLVYLTSHPKGVIKFMDTYEGANVLQGEVRAQIRDDKKSKNTGMMDLFASDGAFVDDAKSRANEPLIDQFWLTHIGSERVIDEPGFAYILEETNWFPGELQASLARLISQKKVQNLASTKTRPKRPLHFEVRGGERLKLIT